MAQRILHPGKHVPKTYQVLLDTAVSEDFIDSLSRGTVIAGRLVTPVEVALMEKTPKGRWVSITLSEGLKREIRIMASTRGFRVERLVRTRIGQLELKWLKPGKFVSLEGETLLDMIIHGGAV